MLEKWEIPRVTIQEFEPNEYVAACYNIKCDVDAANIVENGWILDNGQSNFVNGQTHAADRCGSFGNYYVIDDNNDGIFDGMIEISPDLGRLSCSLYTDDKYNMSGNWNSIKPGSHIYWTTSADDGRTWHHQGVVAYQNASHPNRS